MFAALLWTYFEMPFHDAFTNGEMRTPNNCLRKPSEQLQSGPKIIPSHPEKNILTRRLVERGISYFFSIIQSSFTLKGVNVCSSWSTSICMTMLWFQGQHFWSSIFIVTSTMARRPEHHDRISKFFPSESMVSYDVGALFTSVPVDKAVQHIRNRLEKDERLENRTLARVLPHDHLFSVQGKLLLTKRRCGH